jgi:rhodanese-related sulfurtransferase
MLEDDDLPAILDVRTESEWKGKRIRGSINVPLGGLREHLDRVPRDRQVAIHCATGYRSSVAQSLLRQEGFDQLMDVVGGIVAWETSGLPCETAPAGEGSGA